MMKLRRNIPGLLSIVPMLTGIFMLIASVVPWLNDPFGPRYNAWQLPIYLGWFPRIAILNYGVLCVCCAVLLFLIGYAHYRPFRGSQYFLRRHIEAGVICLVPLVLFFAQYLLIDMQSINQLAQHKIQMLLIIGHYNYRVGAQTVVIKPFVLNIALVGDRFSLLVNQLSFGMLLPCVCSVLLLSYKRSLGSTKISVRSKVIWSIGTLVFILLVGRATLGVACQKLAEQSLDMGNYSDALTWLDRAVKLNPTLDTVTFYHVDRGAALYFLHPNRLNADSHVYLASMYIGRKNFVQAYQQMSPLVSSQGNVASWVNDEMSFTLEELVENSGPLKQRDPSLGNPLLGNANDDATLQWLQPLASLYPNNLYAIYMLGRVHYELRNYSLCLIQMHAITHLSSDTDLLSSAYTYVALSDIEQGNYALGRAELLTAIQLDPNYRNTSAREEMSGIR